MILGGRGVGHFEYLKLVNNYGKRKKLILPNEDTH
jgi:hypothetical protein